jgi:hypothetical protein
VINERSCPKNIENLLKKQVFLSEGNTYIDGFVLFLQNTKTHSETKQQFS